MNVIDLTDIEQKLGVSLPTEYKDVFLSRFSELENAGCFAGSLSHLFLNSSLVIESNLGERQSDAATPEAFPNWWETFFLIGTNGAGDYYSLRIDNSPGVWMIGSDCGDEPTLMSASFENFIDEIVSEHKAKLEAEKQLQLERMNRRLPYQPENTAHLEAISIEEDLKVAENWLDATNCRHLFEIIKTLPFKVSPRKLRLFGIACCKQITAINEDSELVAALALAERMTIGPHSKDEFASARISLKRKRESLFYSSSSWPIKAVHNLFQDDHDYERGAGIRAHEPDLEGVANAVSYSLYGKPYGTDCECSLFREVLGFPFVAVSIDPLWRTQEVVTLAREIYDSEAFEQMPKLAKALEIAGCRDARLLTHCERIGGHARGCWVIDLILGNEPDPFDRKFSWDFQCRHPKINAEVLKEQLEQFGTNGTCDPSDVSSRLEFADWLNGQGAHDWAEYIQVRCALDGEWLGNDYIDLAEKQFECGLGQLLEIEFDNIYFGGHNLVEESWWLDDAIEFYGGIPSMVDAVKPGSESAGPPSELTKRLNALMENTSVRGVNFQEDYANEMAEILNSPEMKSLRLMAFENESSKGESSAVIRALASAPVASDIEYLNIENGIRSDEDATLLAAATLNKLHRLDMKYGKIDCSAAAAESLMTSPWFRNLSQLYCGFGKECAEIAFRELSRMPRLHSLALSRLPDQITQSFSDIDEFKSLRRLAFMGTNLQGELCRRVCELQLPNLIDLGMVECEISTIELKLICDSLLFKNLQAFSLKEPGFNEEGLDMVATSHCASRLRVLRLDCGDGNLNGCFQSLGTTSLAGSSFASLTTLELLNPYTSRAKSDTAKMLRQLEAPKLRHLILKGCDFDDECAAAIIENPSFSNLTRLHLSQRYKRDRLLSPEAAEKLFRSQNMKNILELRFNDLKLGDALHVLTENVVLPNLKRGAFWGTASPKETRELIKQLRPIIYVGS